MELGSGGFGGFFGGGGGPSAFIPYWLGEAGDATITVRDDDGEVVAELGGTGDAGFNHAEWDARAMAAEGERQRFVRPGSYTVEVAAHGRTATGTLLVTRPVRDR